MDAIPKPNRKGDECIVKIWTINTAGLTLPGAQHDLSFRAERGAVNVLFVQ